MACRSGATNAWAVYCSIITRQANSPRRAYPEFNQREFECNDQIFLSSRRKEEPGLFELVLKHTTSTMPSLNQTNVDDASGH
jgi:hypothetical protein